MAQQHKDAEIISDILLKAASEPDFRNMLLSDPASVLAKYELSREAVSIIRRTISDLSQ
ncbi:MAG: hypothetical protein ABI361_00235 [Nitrososphaera sp.]